jgi:hypothetical protein
VRSDRGEEEGVGDVRGFVFVSSFLCRYFLFVLCVSYVSFDRVLCLCSSHSCNFLSFCDFHLPQQNFSSSQRLMCKLERHSTSSLSPAGIAKRLQVRTKQRLLTPTKSLFLLPSIPPSLFTFFLFAHSHHHSTNF